MTAASRRSDRHPGTGGDPQPPRSLLPDAQAPGPEDDRRLRAAVEALERVRTQLLRTQRTLDAFVERIGGGLETGGPAPAGPHAPIEPPRRDPPPGLDEHLRAPGRRSDPPGGGTADR